MAAESTTQHVPGYCGLCISHCGSVATVRDGRFIALSPDPTHPTGQALCAKGRAAPEIVYHPDRLLYPLRRTRPKGDPDPGWQRITWDEALDITAANLGGLADRHGPQSVVFSCASPSTSACADSVYFIQRLMRAFGSPNLCASMELCGWGRASTIYSYGVTSGLGSGSLMPDLEHAGCILYWGYNPSIARISHATSTVSALKRGARLIVVDPRRVGFANKADVWLRVRPGSDGALALGIAGVMIERGWYDHDFVRDWTNAPLLVREDNGRLLTTADLGLSGNPKRYVARGELTGQLIAYDPAKRRFDGDNAVPALFGEFSVGTVDGPVTCRPAFQLVAELCRQYPPHRVAEICWVPAGQLEAAARLLWESRPVASFAWSGVEQHTNVTQFARALALLYSLTGSLETEGGNVVFPVIPQGSVDGREFVTPEQAATNLGIRDRPLGPGRMHFVTTNELYRGIQAHEPHAVHGLAGFGANLLLAHSESARGRDALAALDFYVHTDLFMTPTAEMADIVLPVATPFERESLEIGFASSAEGSRLVQLRPAVIPPLGESRSDTDIVFDLACRLGLGAQFWDGDVDAAYRHQLEPTGIALETLRANPAGERLPLPMAYRQYAESGADGNPRGFMTLSGKVELYSETFLAHGYSPLPHYEEPLISPVSRPDLAARFPLILTTTKSAAFCESQHRGIPSLRRRARDPEIELHPEAAAARGIAEGDWVPIETPEGSVRTRATLNETLEPRVVCGQHGWWQACPQVDAPGYDPFSSSGANLNLIIGNSAVDPVSGSVPHRSYLCEVRPAPSA